MRLEPFRRRRAWRQLWASSYSARERKRAAAPDHRVWSMVAHGGGRDRGPPCSEQHRLSRVAGTRPRGMIDPVIERVLFVAGAILLATCTRSGGSATSGSRPPTDIPEPSARISVTQVRYGGPFFTEGSVSYLALEASNEIVFRKAFRNPRMFRPLIDLESIRPGRYRLTSYQRTCDGSCRVLGPPTARCSTVLDLAAADEVVVTIELRLPQRCAIAVQPAAKIGTSYPFRLLTHCGIGPIYFDGWAWVPRSSLAGLEPNPPPGWGNPFEVGTVRLITGNALVLTSRAGRSLRFRLPPSDHDITFPGCY